MSRHRTSVVAILAVLMVFSLASSTGTLASAASTGAVAAKKKKKPSSSDRIFAERAVEKEVDARFDGRVSTFADCRALDSKHWKCTYRAYSRSDKIWTGTGRVTKYRYGFDATISTPRCTQGCV